MKFEIATIAIALMMGGMVALGVLWGRKFNLIVKENKKLLAELDRNANPPELRYVDIVINSQQKEAIEALQERGMQLFVHFGTNNAIELKAEMDAAVQSGTLYEWLQKRMDISTNV